MFVSQFQKRNWYRPRGYLHFDSRLTNNDRNRIAQLVQAPNKVAQHAFHPFLSYEKKKPKVVNIDGDVRRYVPGTRSICYAAHEDAQIYAYYSSLLSDRYECKIREMGLDANVIAFRKLVDLGTKESKCNIHLANDAFRAILATGPCTVYAFDVKKFFDSLDRTILKRQWCAILGVDELPTDHYAIFKSITNFEFVKRDEAFKKFGISKNGSSGRHRKTLCSREDFRAAAQGTGNFVGTKMNGIPQGSPISAMLANVYMLTFDAAVAHALEAMGGRYFRYCDDVLCIVPNGNDADVQSFVEVELGKLKLKLNPDKTDIAEFKVAGVGLLAVKPIQYLGFIFDGRLEKISIRPTSVTRYRNKLTRAVNLAIATAIKHNAERTAKGLNAEAVYLKTIFRRHSHIGRRNFVSYAKTAVRLMGSTSIRNQLIKFDKFFRLEIARARGLKLPMRRSEEVVLNSVE